MFERFTDRARRVVVLAQEEARMLNHNYIGTEHILLGLIHEGEGVAAKALESLGVSLEAVRQQVEEIIGQGQQAPSGHIPFTPRAKKVLELSLREALQLGHNYIGTEHILLGLIHEGEGVAAQVLVRLGGDLNRVRQQVVQLVHSEGGSEADRPPLGRSPRGLERSEILKTLAALSDRLAAIERHLGMARKPAGEGAAAGLRALAVISDRLSAIERHLRLAGTPEAEAAAEDEPEVPGRPQAPGNAGTPGEAGTPGAAETPGDQAG